MGKAEVTKVMVQVLDGNKKVGRRNETLAIVYTWYTRAEMEAFFFLFNANVVVLCTFSAVLVGIFFRCFYFVSAL